MFYSTTLLCYCRLLRPTAVPWYQLVPTVSADRYLRYKVPTGTVPQAAPTELCVAMPAPLGNIVLSKKCRGTRVVFTGVRIRARRSQVRYIYRAYHGGKQTRGRRMMVLIR